LIDMRGRVYDPLAGRFMTADPIMQAPFSTQGLNRYSYVFNDPINATDPSGFLGISPGYPAGAVVTGGWGDVGGIGFSAGINIATTVINGLPQSVPSGTYAVAPASQAPTTASATRSTQHAVGQNRAGVGPADTQDGSSYDRQLSQLERILETFPDEREAAIPYCDSKQHVPGKTACLPRGTTSADFVVGTGSVVTRGAAKLGAGLLARLLGRWFPRLASKAPALAKLFGSSPERIKLLERVITPDGGVNVSATVAKQLAGQRAFIPNQAIMETIGSGTRLADPKGVAGHFMYKVPASVNGSGGTLEVLVDEVSAQVRHVLFRSGP
jgi:hypothetical protein